MWHKEAWLFLLTQFYTLFVKLYIFCLFDTQIISNANFKGIVNNVSTLRNLSCMALHDISVFDKV